MSGRIFWRNIQVTDRVKIRAYDLRACDMFEFMGNVYQVAMIQRGRIVYRLVGEYTVYYGFGENSNQFVYKVLLENNS